MAQIQQAITLFKGNNFSKGVVLHAKDTILFQHRVKFDWGGKPMVSFLSLKECYKTPGGTSQ